MARLHSVLLQKLSSTYCIVSIIAQQQMDGKRSGDQGILMNGPSVHVCVCVCVCEMWLWPLKKYIC